ncbi:MAG: hypothetical protein AB3N20_15710 [Rhizobiaceae bacterium]
MFTALVAHPSVACASIDNIIEPTNTANPMKLARINNLHSLR